MFKLMLNPWYVLVNSLEWLQPIYHRRLNSGDYGEDPEKLCLRLSYSRQFELGYAADS